MQPQLKFLDRYLTAWIFIAMAVGIAIGYFYPNFSASIIQLSIGNTNLPIAIGLIVMMYPPLAKVDYSLLPKALQDKKTIGISLLLNWVLGTLLMFFLAVFFLSNHPEYMSGLILIGLARCIAMVLVWNDLAQGNREYAALLVALNSVFQVISYPFLVWLFITELPAQLGLKGFEAPVSLNAVLESVLIYLGIPFLAGFLSRFFMLKWKGEIWYRHTFIPAISPLTLYALLFTIVLMFSLKGDQIIALPFDVLRVALPLVLYFIIMFFVTFFVNIACRIPYDKNAAVAFTATGNNFELAIAVAIGVFGIHSPQAFVGVIGPLIEVPVLILLVKASHRLKHKYYPKTP